MSVTCARGAVPRIARRAGIAHSMSPSPGCARTIAMRSAPTLTSAERVAQRALRRPERQLLPRHLPGRERPYLGRLLSRPRDTPRDRGEHDEHDPVLGAGVDAHQLAEVDLDLQLLARLASSRVLHRLAEVDEPARERPQPGARVERAPQQPHASLMVARDRARDRLRVVIGAVAAVPAGDRSRVGDLGLRAAPRAVPDVLESGVETRLRGHRVQYARRHRDEGDAVAGPLAGLKVIELAGIGPGPF